MSSAATLMTSKRARAVERRQVSVLFTDMVGYTAIVEELGEEKALELTQQVYESLTKTVQDHGGAVRAFAGDSIMALFGIPEAQEDAALRACRAALAIQEEFSNSADKFEVQFNVRPTMRVGISSGIVMMAAVEGDDAPVTAVGSTVNLASRIQSLAPEGGCLMCDSTRRQVKWVVDIDLHGESKVKGMSKPQKLWEIQAIRADTKRFDASVAKGLSKFVGRDKELTTLQEGLKASRIHRQWADLIAEPGLGKTRLLFEFLKYAKAENVPILRGHCSPDGQQIPFLPFIEVVRRHFDIRGDNDHAVIIEKLKAGLKKDNLETDENLGLLLNLLGQPSLKGALEGLDGVLIGLRTRALLFSILVSKHRDQSLIVLLEDIHWIDGPSEELLIQILKEDRTPNLFVINTRRPHYDPPWISSDDIQKIALKPLNADAIVSLAQSWIGADDIPKALIKQLTERSGGNPLFGEEILSFMLDEGALTIGGEGDEVDFNPEALPSVLPASMQSLLTSKVDRLSKEDREVLQIAAVIGQRFDIDLLALLFDDKTTIDKALKELVAQDLIYQKKTLERDYAFKHTLLRETVYQSMVSDRKRALHLDIAQALEKHYQGNSSEKEGMLAYHYALTDKHDLAFKYGAQAGAKSVGIFALDEANKYFQSTFELYEKDSDCANDEAFISFLADYALCCNISLNVKTLLAIAEKTKSFRDALGSHQKTVLFLHHYISCLIYNGRYLDALAVSKELSSMAEQLGDPISKAYALVSEMSISNYCAPMDNESFTTKKTEAENALKTFDDAYLHNFFLGTTGWNEIVSGRVMQAHQIADRLLEKGDKKRDPRSLGYGKAMKALIAMLGDDHSHALELSKEALDVSQTEFDSAIARSSKHSALIALEQPNAVKNTQNYISLCQHHDWSLFSSGPDAMLGVGYALEGKIGEGIKHIEGAIKRRETEGSYPAADWSRLYLCELYLAVLSGEGDASLGVVMRNITSLSRIIFSGQKRIISLVEQVRKNAQFEKDGHYFARCELILGMLYKIKKKPKLAKQHLLEAQRIVDPSGPSPMLTRINEALAEL